MKINLSKAGIILLSAFLFQTYAFSQETTDEISSGELPKIYTFIDSGVVEQRISFSKEEIENSNAQDITSFFQSAGIQILSYGPYGLESKPSIRGFTDETVRVIIDGICVNNAQYGTFDFSTLNIDNIEKIEIVKGGFTEQVSDEGAVGGAVYITTKKQILGHHFTTDSSVKSFFNKNIPFDTFIQKLGYTGQFSENTFFKANLKGSYAQNKFPFVNYRNSISIRENAEVLDSNADLNFSHFFGNGNSWNISNLFYISDKNIPGTETSKTPGNQKDLDNNLSFSLNFPAILDFIKINTAASWLSNSRHYTEQTQSRHYVNTIIFSLSGDFYKFSKYKQSAGITLNYTYLNSTDDGIHSKFSGTLKETSKFYINDFFSFTIPLSLKIENKNIEFIPKLGLRTDFKYFDFMINSYRMVQFPNMDDLYWGDSSFACGNPNLKPEHGWGAEFIINGHDIIIPFSLCFFTNYYKDKIQWAADSTGKWSPENIASAFYFGIDFSFKKTFFNIITLKGNIEYLYNKLLDKSNPLTYGKKIMWTPDFTGSLSISLNLEKLFISIESHYTGKKYTSNLNTSFSKPYFLINASAEFKYIKHFNPYIKIENILDTDYEAIPNYPMPGISLHFGIKTKF